MCAPVVAAVAATYCADAVNAGGYGLTQRWQQRREMSFPKHICGMHVVDVVEQLIEHARLPDYTATQLPAKQLQQ